MPASSNSANYVKTPRPVVSIILPTYNRAHFLPEAISSICGQNFDDWELIVIDDGSTDETPRLIERLATNVEQRTVLVRQTNQGAYSARNMGMQHAAGKYFAFYDSDDVWLPHHLTDCVRALEENPDMDWVFAACRIVSYTTKATIAESHFYRGSGYSPFLDLAVDRRGEINVIDDPNIIPCAIKYGLECGLQHSVMRRHVLADRPFCTEFRNEAEDQLAVIRAAAAGIHFGYLKNVHVEYMIHNENSSAVGENISVEKKAAVFEALVRGFKRLPADVSLSVSAQRALRWRLARELFWHIGYATLWSSGRRREALQAFRSGIHQWPWDIRYWKTYLSCLLKRAFSAAESDQSKCGVSQHNA